MVLLQYWQIYEKAHFCKARVRLGCWYEQNRGLGIGDRKEDAENRA
ncbi:hypothetical protein [Chlorogloeopsis sp. ULAP02]